MNIRYLDPLSRAWTRMKKALFSPFDLKTWFVVGFTAFLAGVTEGPGGGGGGGGSKFKKEAGEICDLGGVIEAPKKALEWLTASPERIVIGTLIVLVLFFIVMLVVWLSSRGKFMFLYNVVLKRSEIVKPWHEYSREGNSLCVWSIVFGFVCMVFFALFVGLVFKLLTLIHYDALSGMNMVLRISGLACLFIAFLLIIGYIWLFLNDFIVPIMYKHRLTASAAWKRFSPLFREYAFHFILYGVLLFLVYIGIVIVVVLFGLFTCCIGFFLLAIPYINSVVTLPISYTLRGFSVEFLAQFGTKFNVLQTPRTVVKKKS
jgi:hypothetical protein